MVEDLIPLTFDYQTSRSGHKLLEKIVEKRCEQAKLIDYGLAETSAVLKLANTPETRWLLQGELKAIKDGHVYKEITNKNGTYRGYVNQDGEEEGVGITTFDDGTKYSGEYKGGPWNGVIKAEFSYGDICWGMFKDGQQNGYNTYQWKNGDTNTGQWKNGKRDGYCLCRFSDGATYHGQYNEDKSEGYGIVKYPDNSEYDGQFENEKRSGIAVWTDSGIGIIQRQVW